jgi:hypothetical protein
VTSGGISHPATFVVETGKRGEEMTIGEEITKENRKNYS